MAKTNQNHEPDKKEQRDPISTQLAQRVKDLRSARTWSLDELSVACGVSRSMLSQIERDQVNPTLAVTFRIAEAFGITLGELLECPEATSRIEVIRADDRTHHYRSGENCQIRTLSPLYLEREFEFYEIRLSAEGALRSAAHFKGTREFLTVEKGQIRVESGSDAATLQHGDSANYPADIHHAIINIGDSEAVAFLVVIYR